MIEFITLVLIAWGILIFGFLRKDYAISTISAWLIMVLGVSLMIYGFTIPNFVVDAFGIAFLAIGFYMVVRGSWETYRKDEWKGFRKMFRG